MKKDGEYPVLRLTKDAPIVTATVRPLADERVPLKTVSPDQATGKVPPPNFTGNPVHGLRWLPDGEHFLQVKRGLLWKVHATSGRVEPFFDAAKLAAALAKIPSLDGAIAKEIAGHTNFNMNSQATAFLFDHAHDLYFAAFDGSKAVRLTKTPAVEELATFSPDGKWVAFVREQNLYVVDIATQSERKLTVDGGGRIFNGKADWVYYEEVFNRNRHAFWWSPNSRHLAFLRIDDTPVAPFTVVDHIPVHQKLEQTPYPKSGDPNPLGEARPRGRGRRRNSVRRLGRLHAQCHPFVLRRLDAGFGACLCLCHRSERNVARFLGDSPRPGDTREIVPRENQSLGGRSGRSDFPQGRFLLVPKRTIRMEASVSL